MYQIRCNQQVTYHRKCGHKIQIPCYACQSCVPKCDVVVKAENPLCLHECSIPCSQRNTISCIPWGTNFFVSEEGKKLKQGILCEIVAPPESVLAEKCQSTIKLQRECGHTISLSCWEAFSIVRKKKKLLCQEPCPVTLTCKHTTTLSCAQYSQYKNKPESYQCGELTERPCWNFTNCKQTRQVRCSSTALVVCDSIIPWQCSSGHTFNLPVCLKGVPSLCPTCILEQVKDNIDSINDNLPTDLPSIFNGLTFTQQPLQLHLPFQASIRKTMLERYYDKLSEQQDWERPAFAPCFIPVYSIKENMGSKKTEWGFGIQLYLFTKRNIQFLLDKARKKKHNPPPPPPPPHSHLRWIWVHS